ncbi:MAG: peptide chain release factor N(5)-glutamine methyltransferase [Candidatus Omnitrophota bacterium]
MTSDRTQMTKINEKQPEKIPVQYVEGKACFMDMEIKIDHRALIPRPETELLVSTVARFCREKGWKVPFVLDVGTGSGVIPLGLVRLLKDCRVIGSDVSCEALLLARENLARFGYEDRITLVRSDMFDRFKDGYLNTFDVIVSNPPYVSQKDYENLDPWVLAEPREALYGGIEGMDYLNILAEKSWEYLRPDGLFAVEVGYDQGEKMKDKLRACGFCDVESFKDFNDHERVIVGWKNG